ncbi:MAG TPA: MFS transporter [Acidimicrobiia bacterium]|nr:MFS transporter [Acidimicrobiia bacterium]
MSERSERARAAHPTGYPFGPDTDAVRRIDPREVTAAQLRPWRIFGTSAYFRLWMAQVVSSIGDWLGLFAILAIAGDVSNRPEAAISLVMVARMAPGFLLAGVGGVIADRVDRKKLMVICDLGRAGVVALLPFVTNLAELFLASLVLEVLTLLWTPAKDASVPNLVPEDKLVSANALGMVAGFGMMPIGAALFASLSALAEQVRDSGLVDFVRVDQEFLALWVDAGTFLLSSFLIVTLALPPVARRASTGKGRRIDWMSAWHDLTEGLRFIASHRLVRSVMIGLGGGLLGGAAAIPLGPVYVKEVLGSDDSGFGLLMMGMGVGAAVGVIGLSTVQRYFPRELAFAGALIGSGAAVLAVSSVDRLALAVPLVGLFGLAASSGYVAGFTLLHENVSDELRGRTFAALYTVIRLTLVLSLTIWPLVAGVFDSLSTRWFEGEIAGVAVPGVRLALWLGALVVVVTGAFAVLDVHRARREARGSTGKDAAPA